MRRAVLSLALAGTSLVAVAAALRELPPVADLLPRSASADVRRPDVTDEHGGLQFRLSEGEPPTDAGEPIPRPSAEPLDAARTRELLSRVPALPAAEGDTADFALREKSLPPPRTGRTVAEPFPPPTDAGAPDPGATGPLTVLRHQPEGDVPLAPNVSVTFSQPMVAVTSHDELAAEAPPVRISPEPPGRWRWVGTRTLLFEPVRAAHGETEDASERGRFPMATEYVAEIPAGTRSAVGGELGETVRFTFTTPPPRLVTSDPSGRSTVRDPLLFAAFDQRIDRDAVLATIRLDAGGAVPVRLATGEEIQADERIRELARGALPGRWLAFRPTRALPAATAVTVTVGPGTPSAEGPRRTTEAQRWSFRTYGPLQVVEHRCGWSDECPPRTPWNVRFSNALDREAMDPAQIRVEPELPGTKVNVWGETLAIQGLSRGRTTYTVTLDAGIRDVFGQTLGEDVELTFTTTRAHPRIWSSGQGLVVLDPAARPGFSVFSVNHDALKVRVHAVGPDDWPAFQQWMQEAWRDDRTHVLPGRSVIDTTVGVAAKPDELVETRIDLAPALRDGLGQLVLEVEPARRVKGRGRDAVRAWVQATRIGLTAFADATELTGWATALEDGRPLAGALLSLGTSRATTGPDGLAKLGLGSAEPLLVARQGQDVAILPQHTGWWSGGGWHARPEAPSARFFVFDDRGMYKPGEQAHVKGWVRVVEPGPQGQLAPAGGAITAVEWRLRDTQNNEVAKGTAPVDAWGGFALTLDLPATMNLGPSPLTLEARGRVSGRAHHALQVQEFRRPEFEVTAAATEGPHVIGGHALVTTTAAYYAGGALPDAEVRWEATSSPGRFTPPNRSDFVFGRFVPWWMPLHGDDDGRGRKVKQLAGRTGPDGRHVLRVDFDGVEPPQPSHLQVEATVTDVNRQAWTASSQLLVHPSLAYVGLRTSRPFVPAGQPIVIEGIVVDLDGRAVPGRPVEITGARLSWEQKGDAWREVEKDPQTCERTSAGAVFTCELATKLGGSYRVRARTTDAEGRPNETELRVWVMGGDQPPSRGLERDEVTLVPGQREYAAGDVAEVLVVAPFAPAEGLLTLRRSGLLRTERFRMEGGTHALRIPIEEGFTPNVWVQVDLVGRAPRPGADGRPDPSLGGRPAFASGQVELRIPPAARKLQVDATPRDKGLDPGASTDVELVVKDAAGRPVAGAQVAVVVADEAVLALSGYDLPDPLAVFYAGRGDGVEDRHMREHVVLARPEDLAEEDGAGDVLAERAEMGMVAGAAPAALPPPPPPPAPQAMMRAKAADAAPEPAPAIAVRTDFRPLAFYDPAVVTGPDGRARVAVKLPESLTRYRVMAVAATKQDAGDVARFGSGESTITVRLPLMVRPSPPRFLNFGDTFELPVVVQNQTDAPLAVDVAVRAANAEPAEGIGRRITVPANDRAEVLFPAAAKMAGTARFQIVAAAGRHADAAQVALPVWTPATTEAFATYGHVDEGAMVQPVRPPGGVVPQFGGLEVTTSSTALQALTDAVLYLVAYPFECSEQMASRVLAVAALRDVLQAFEAKGLPPPAEIVDAVARDVKMLERLQNADGGWPFWRRGDPSWPYVSIHVAHALQRAQGKGFDVPKPTLDAARKHLQQIERHIPSHYGAEARRTLMAYALYVRKLMGDADAAGARQLYSEAGGVSGLSFEALGFMLEVMAGDSRSATEVAAIRRHLDNRVTETAAAAHFAVDYGDDAHLLLYSDRRADAVLLDALIATAPKSDLIPKLVAGLLAHRKAGRWTNTQENAFVLLALDRYFQTYEKVTPDFVARLWLGERFAGEQAFRGRSTDRRHLSVPMRWLAEAGPTDLVLAKDGPGRLYYRIGMSYAPADLRLAPADHGFTVERRYEGVDDPADVRQDPDGTWRIRAGARVRVQVTMVAPARRYHVALVDPLPAGLEALNPALAVTGRVPDVEPQPVHVMGARGLGGPGRPGGWWWWSRPWYEHQNLRDERVEAFTSLLWEGVYTYAYVARATTPGTFVVPPPKAEEMYHPETFGRGASAIVVVD